LEIVIGRRKGAIRYEQKPQIYSRISAVVLDARTEAAFSGLRFRILSQMMVGKKKKMMEMRRRRRRRIKENKNKIMVTMAVTGIVAITVIAMHYQKKMRKRMADMERRIIQ
jgi:hypothetical protein